MAHSSSPGDCPEEALREEVELAHGRELQIEVALDLCSNLLVTFRHWWPRYGPSVLLEPIVEELWRHGGDIGAERGANEKQEVGDVAGDPGDELCEFLFLATGEGELRRDLVSEEGAKAADGRDLVADPTTGALLGVSCEGGPQPLMLGRRIA